jgi:DNA (cytosine-5)-methyltransferase 1
LYVEVISSLSEVYPLEFVVFENVLGIKDRKHGATFARLQEGLRTIGLAVSCNECCALDYGVPQIRRRVIVTGLARGGNKPLVVSKRDGARSVKDAIAHLGSPVYFRHGMSPHQIPIHPNHWTSRPRSKRFRTPLKQWKPTRSFKRTFWSKPSPTIAFGHREIHIHPTGKRRLSIYEAMLIQGFPAGFILKGNLTQQVEQVSNAVPPPLAEAIAQAIIARLGVDNVCGH